MEAKSSCKKKGGLGWEGLQKGKERGLDNGALSGGVGSRLPPKHEVSTPVNEKTRGKAGTSSRTERERADIALTLVTLRQQNLRPAFSTIYLHSQKLYTTLPSQYEIKTIKKDSRLNTT